MKPDHIAMFQTTMDGNLLTHLLALVRLDQQLLRDDFAREDLPLWVHHFVAFCEATLRKKRGRVN